MLMVFMCTVGTSIESVGRLRQEALRLSKERAFLLTRYVTSVFINIFRILKAFAAI